MKLYNVYINNGWDYEDENDNMILIVAENENSANARARLLLLERYGEGGTCNTPYYEVKEITKVDNFKILLVKED